MEHGMTAGEHLSIGEIVQLAPGACRSPVFSGCMMVVTELRSWGAQGYVQMTGANGEPGGQAYYRAIWAEMEATGGMAPFVVGGKE